MELVGTTARKFDRWKFCWEASPFDFACCLEALRAKRTCSESLTKLQTSLLHQHPNTPDSPRESSFCAPESARPSQESGAHGCGSNRRGCREREPEAVVVDESRFELHIRG